MIILNIYIIINKLSYLLKIATDVGYSEFHLFCGRNLGVGHSAYIL